MEHFRIHSILRRLLADPFVPKSGSVLEFGFGNGDVALAFASRGFHVEAIDKDVSAVESLQKRAREAGISLSVRMGNVEEAVSLRGSYEYIIALNVLPFVSDKTLVMKILKSFFQRAC